jgi:hypothetical protein
MIDPPAGVENKLGLLAAPASTLSYAVGALCLVGCHFFRAEGAESVACRQHKGAGSG